MHKIADISKIERSLYSKLYFLKLFMYVHLQTKFQVYSLIVTSFRQGGSFTPSATPHHAPLKRPARLELKNLMLD